MRDSNQMNNDEAKNTPEAETSSTTSGGGSVGGGAGGAGVVPGIRPIALVGHAYMCPVPGHQASVIVSGSPTCEVDGRPIARIGDMTSCGAVIISGSKNAYIDDNRPIARKGDKGIHVELGVIGEIIEGVDKWTLE